MPIRTPYGNTTAIITADEIVNLQFLIREFVTAIGIDLGTAWGGSALVMADAGVKETHTYDKKNFVSEKDGRIFYHIGNVFNPPMADEVKALCGRPERKLLFCDNGNKKREINLFGPCLQAGDVLAAHDFGTELKLKDVAGMIQEHGFERISLPHENLLAAWVKR